MSKIDTFFELLSSPNRILLAFSAKGFLNWIPDNLLLKVVYWSMFGEKLNLENPVKFNEKMQWLKLYDRKPLYTTMVDKYTVKNYVSSIIGEEYIIPTLQVFDSFDEIDFDKLPKQFVIKCNHDSGSIVICKDKNKLDVNKAREKIQKGMANNSYFYFREWPYKNVKRKIIIEQFMKDSISEDLTDYKFYCFNGRPQFCQVIKDRTVSETIDFFDMNWVHQEFTGLGLPTKPFSPKKITKPKTFEKMKWAAEQLSVNIPFARIDFYEIDGRMYFGEITFFPAAGFGQFTPDKWNTVLGEMINLPKV